MEHNLESLETEFPFNMDFPEPSYKSQRDRDLATGYRFANILRYIIKNECRLEHKSNIDSDDWEEGTLREFLRYATGVPYKENPEFAGFQDYLKFWRIKRTVSQNELDRIIKITDKEEL